MGFIIKATHRKTGDSMYFGGMYFERMENGKKVLDVETERFDSLREASEHPFLDEEDATMALGTFPETKNIDYEVVEAGSQ